MTTKLKPGMRVLYKARGRRPGAPSDTPEANDVVAMPEAVEEAGLAVGAPATVDKIYAGGRGMHVILDRADGSTAGFASLRFDVNSGWRVADWAPMVSDRWISDAAFRNLDPALRRDLLKVLHRDRYVGQYAANAGSDLRALGEHELAGRLLEGLDELPSPLRR